ncbi:MAG: DUF2721 domain-containing protein [Candidatus Cloacimonetes bacterium]|nr:DUF2721 domain-containing protein [Candidatus Cloacimonadota bacterium]
MENIQYLIKLLQSSISPIVLISGVGLLLLSQTNRLGRVIDRTRHLVKEIENDKTKKEKRKVQITILYKRGRLLRLSITAISITIFFAGLMILLLFLGYFTQFKIDTLFLTSFIIAVFGLILSIILFLFDISLSLKALKHQIREIL